MDNKFEVEYENGAFTWRVMTVRGVTLCSGSSCSRMEAAAQAVKWIEGQI